MPQKIVSHNPNKKRKFKKKCLQEDSGQKVLEARMTLALNKCPRQTEKLLTRNKSAAVEEEDPSLWVMFKLLKAV